MKKQLFLTAFCAGCLALGAQAQLHSGTTTDTTQPSQPSDDSSKSSTWDRIKNLAATGRNPVHEVRASQLTSADVKSSSGDSVGTISDVIINPNSGKVDFAVLSLGSSTSANTPTSGTTGTSSTTSGTARSTTGTATTTSETKQVAVPWTLLRPANMGASTTATPSTAQQTFTYSGDTSKLQTAPAYDPNTDITKPGWLQSVFSHFGVNAGSATGGATSPGSSSSGSSSGNNRSYPQGNPSNNP